ncbi:LysE family translocator [Collimonas sp. NPDC087041]|uniref:LysE family translocator n=1 Tax=Collimonas sp. NPDC087041 TaxID=3363960 RepID=UPI0038159F4A
MDFHSFFLFVLTEVVLSLSPGPAVMLVVAYGITAGWKKSLFATLGILTANAIYFAISATGLGALIVASHTLFTVVKWLGVAYLAYLGLSAIFGRPSPITASQLNNKSPSGWKIWLSGLTLQLANPKALIFFIAILPQFLNPAGNVPLQMVWLAAGSIIPEFFILLGYAVLAGKMQTVATRPSFARITDRVAGSLMLGVAMIVAAIQK